MVKTPLDEGSKPHVWACFKKGSRSQRLAVPRPTEIWDSRETSEALAARRGARRTTYSYHVLSKCQPNLTLSPSLRLSGYSIFEGRHADCGVEAGRNSRHGSWAKDGSQWHRYPAIGEDLLPEGRGPGGEKRHHGSLCVDWALRSCMHHDWRRNLSAFFLDPEKIAHKREKIAHTGGECGFWVQWQRRREVVLGVFQVARVARLSHGEGFGGMKTGMVWVCSSGRMWEGQFWRFPTTLWMKLENYDAPRTCRRAVVFSKLLVLAITFMFFCDICNVLSNHSPECPEFISSRIQIVYISQVEWGGTREILFTSVTDSYVFFSGEMKWSDSSV